MKILIADDDVTSRAVLTSVLQRCGHETVVASDGQGAWEALERPDAPRVAILDWIMPGLDGAEVCRRAHAREREQSPYLILVTSRGAKADIVEGLGAGADDYLAKPFDPLELSARVEVGCRVIALQDRLGHKVRELQEALAKIITLRGIVPVCANCDRIRDEKGGWTTVEAYVKAHSGSEVSHSLCPACTTKLYPEFASGLYPEPTVAPGPPSPSNSSGPGSASESGQ